MKWSIPFPILVYLFASPLMAIGGLTGNGILIPSARSLADGIVEVHLDSSLYHAHYEYWDNGRKKRIPATETSAYPGEVYSTISENGLSLGLSAGFGSGWEAGLAYGHTTSETGDGGLAITKYNELQVGAKYSFFDSTRHAIALQMGANLEPVRWTVSGEAGFLYSIIPTTMTHIDFDLRYYGSQDRQQKDQRAQEKGVILQVGGGFRWGRIAPSLELSYHETRTHIWRQHRISNDYLPYARSGFVKEQIDVYGILNVDPLVTIDVNGTNSVSFELEPIKERVLHIQRVLQATAGTSIDLNDQVTLSLSFTQDLSGSNTLAGQTVATMITMTF